MRGVPYPAGLPKLVRYTKPKVRKVPTPLLSTLQMIFEYRRAPTLAEQAKIKPVAYRSAFRLPQALLNDPNDKDALAYKRQRDISDIERKQQYRTDAAKFAKEAFGYTFVNDDLLLTALDTTGVRSSGGKRRLALLGDAILRFAILDDWYPTGTSTDTGTELCAQLGSNVNLAAVGRAIGLERHVVIKAHNADLAGAAKLRTMATTMEALIGAIYLDSGKDFLTARRALTLVGLKMSPKKLSLVKMKAELENPDGVIYRWVLKGRGRMRPFRAKSRPNPDISISKSPVL